MAFQYQHYTLVANLLVIIFDCVFSSTDRMKTELDQFDCNIPKRFGSHVVLIFKWIKITFEWSSIKVTR